MALSQSARARRADATPRLPVPVPRSTDPAELRSWAQVSRRNVRAHMQAAHGCRDEGDRAGTLDAVRAAHSASRYAVRCLQLARQLQAPLYGRLPILGAADRLQRRHGSAQHALTALNRSLRRVELRGLRAAFWESVQVTLCRRTWDREGRS